MRWLPSFVVLTYEQIKKRCDEKKQCGLELKLCIKSVIKLYRYSGSVR